MQSMWDGHLERTNIARLCIELLSLDTATVDLASYCTGPNRWEFRKGKKDKKITKNVIKPAQTEWGAPVVPVSMTERALSFYTNCRKSNTVTKWDPYPISCLNGCFDSLGEVTVFSPLNVNSGCWQVDIKDNDKDINSFTSHYRIYQFVEHGIQTLQGAMSIPAHSGRCPLHRWVNLCFFNFLLHHDLQ